MAEHSDGDSADPARRLEHIVVAALRARRLLTLVAVALVIIATWISLTLGWVDLIDPQYSVSVVIFSMRFAAVLGAGYATLFLLTTLDRHTWPKNVWRLTNLFFICVAAALITSIVYAAKGRSVPALAVAQWLYHQLRFIGLDQLGLLLGGVVVLAFASFGCCGGCAFNLFGRVHIVQHVIRSV